VGVGAFKLGIAGGFLAVVAYALIGGLTGVVAGRPPWRQETVWTTALKGIFGALVGCGLYWAARKVLGGAHLAMVGRLGLPDRPLVELPALLGPLIGAVWGIFVEIDDGIGAKPAAAKPARR
ncbi:MAG TPA: hypothetical protein VFG23_23960, partial [Polyangia bacterium]|nr:hypothetical protein [Polyangia bacterium]